jgi:hypothetical protein
VRWFRRQEFTHLLLEKIGQFAATPGWTSKAEQIPESEPTDLFSPGTTVTPSILLSTDSNSTSSLALQLTLF